VLVDGTDLYENPQLYELEHGSYRGDFAFYLAVAARAQPQTVLELGCGTGRITLELARAGYLVTGVDAVPAMLERLRHNMFELSRDIVARIRIRPGDACNYREQGKRFGLVIAPFNLLQHLDEAGLTDLLRNARAQLADTGRFACDLFAPMPTSTTLDEPDFSGLERRALPRSAGTLLVDRRERYDRSQRVLTTTVRCRRLGADDSLVGSEQRTLCRRQWTRDQLLQVFATAGLVVEACYGNVDLSPWQVDSPRIMIIARPA